MDCANYRKLISAFVDSEVTPLEHLALQEHLKVCPECKSELMVQYYMQNMIKDAGKCEKEVNFTASVMKKVCKCKQCKDTAFAKLSRAVVVGMVFAATLATMLYSFPNGADVVVKPAAISPDYTSYIYRHVDDTIAYADIYVEQRQFKQATFTR
jgi:anti-sigma factor RsiW